MTRTTPRINITLAGCMCALLFGLHNGAANAQMCMKKSYGKGYMTPMHPHPMQRRSGPAQPPYAYPRHGYRAPGFAEWLDKDAGEERQKRDAYATGDVTQSATPEADIVQTAMAAGDFNTLIKAVVAADLYDTLRSEGPFTLFAPTDTAFSRLPEGMLEGLLADKEMLVSVLGYHLVPGRVTAAELIQQREFKTVQGQTLSIDMLSVVSADIETANGVVHVIDNVVLPSL